MLRILEDLAEPEEDRGEAEKPLPQPSISTLDIQSDHLYILPLFLSISIISLSLKQKYEGLDCKYVKK